MCAAGIPEIAGERARDTIPPFIASHSWQPLPPAWEAAVPVVSAGELCTRLSHVQTSGCIKWSL